MERTGHWGNDKPMLKLGFLVALNRVFHLGTQGCQKATAEISSHKVFGVLGSILKVIYLKENINLLLSCLL